jgi:MFS family permease
MPDAVKPALAAFVLTFLFTLHATPATYINSNFLAQFFNPQEIGWLFALGAAAGILGLALTGRAVRRFGSYRVLSTVLYANLAVSLALAWAPSALVAGAAFCLGFSAGVMANFLIDIFVEAASKDSQTGMLRGWYLTAANAAFLAGPGLAALVLTDHQFHRVYLLGAALIVVTLVYVRRRFKTFADPSYVPGGFRNGFLKIWGDPDLRRAFASFLVLQGFYAWMIIYAPLHLTQTIGFDLSQVAAIMAIALLPFLILQEWLGKLADCCTGEKEFLGAGLAVMGVSTIGLALIDSRSFVVWTLALFATASAPPWSSRCRTATSSGASRRRRRTSWRRSTACGRPRRSRRHSSRRPSSPGAAAPARSS